MGDRPPRVSLRDVAQRAGVSVTTASRVLCGRGDFAPGTRERVLDAAESLHYRRDSTRSGRPVDQGTSVDLVVGDISPVWTDRVISGAWRAASRRELDLTVTRERAGSIESWTTVLARRRSRGVIFGLAQPLRSQVDGLLRARIPVVLLDPLSEIHSVRSVAAANWAGGFEAGRHLVDRGADQFIAIVGRPPYQFASARTEGFAAAISQAVPATPIISIAAGWDDTGPISGLSRMLGRAQGRVGIFASNDHLALRSYQAVRRAGLEVGIDVLVVGFDDEPRAASSHPALTSVHQPLEAMAAHAVELVARSLDEGRPPAPGRDELAVHLIARESTATSTARPVDADARHRR